MAAGRVVRRQRRCGRQRRSRANGGRIRWCRRGRWRHGDLVDLGSRGPAARAGSAATGALAATAATSSAPGRRRCPGTGGVPGTGGRGRLLFVIARNGVDALDNSLVYFLDDTNQTALTPQGYGVIGEYAPRAQHSRPAAGSSGSR